ncbi:General transcription factor II-I repeat domain-containing protein 2 [Chionoecetes opilio]|uniref:General transcription factor II-I repeat domain-containing protein 2 n=1 Tax=Chionoecetes opilio TaxID=41210 RepID=A0A8J8WMN1_CHIOP|nr:General transcription factor II-I repeat domain-containing protein 2 [Chionoecetes opilio]
MLSCVCDLQQEIATFLRQKNLPGADHFSNPQWLARLALLTDITTHLNDLNVKLQGKNILVTDMYSHITAFEPLAPGFKLFTSPFDFPVDEAPAPLQMELVELQCNDELKAKYSTASPLSFFRDLVLPSNKFPNYIEHGLLTFRNVGAPAEEGRKREGTAVRPNAGDELPQK